MDYNYQETPCEYDEFISKGICAASPNVSALQETILIYLKELAYYLLKLKELGATNDVIKEHILEGLSGIITNVDYNQQQFARIITILASDLSQSKTFYANLCIKNNIEAKFLNTFFKHFKDFDITEIIKRGERYHVKRNTEYTFEQKNLFDIMILLVKRICLKILQVKSFNKDYEKAYNIILLLLDSLNAENLSEEKAKTLIETSNAEYYNLFKSLSDAQEEFYGPRESVYISFTPRNGKAILVSGIDMTQLEAVLNATKNKGIDVYTHGMTMLMAHTLAKFREYPHLVGHFGKGSENSLFDFAAFPGAILMTSYLFQKVEYLYRGRLFTTDSFAPSGIVRIKENNFEPLIQAALHSKGFTKNQQEIILRVGFRQKVLEDKVQELTEKMLKNEIKHLYFVGILHSENEFKEYFDKFFELMPKDCYAVSLSYERNEENILHVDSFYDYLLIYKILEKFNEKNPLKDLKITLFITKCDQYTVTNIINFTNMGVKNIYLCKCLPTILNPCVLESLKKTFGIKEFSNPEQDLKDTLI